ncbi:hypothetical protein ADUPG1_013231 [Aduncisulcus paluster]|uniref:Uncharacterized protein n=1 Tax=Aduncisulcus paluster TaxID=2918883 RepID=A0ABQ5K293_9EUKA|nr:hypothetical protein ADUPG1_013231 [Aduncisulcus paluster]
MSKKILPIKAIFKGVGDSTSPPFFRDDPIVVPIQFERVSGKIIKHKSKKPLEYSCINAFRSMLRGESTVSTAFSEISIPFSIPSHIKGLYVCVSKSTGPLFLCIRAIGCDKVQQFKKYAFHRPQNESEWYFLPFEMYDVVQCEIGGKGTWENFYHESVTLNNLFFVRQETSVESITRQLRQKLISEAPISKGMLKSGKGKIRPICFHDSSIIPLDIGNVQAKIEHSKSKLVLKHVKNSKSSIPLELSRICQFDHVTCAFRQMLRAQFEESEKDAEKTFLGKGVEFSHLNIPFMSPNNVKGVYICVNLCISPDKFTLLFIHSDGTYSVKKYELLGEKKSSVFEWYFLPIGLKNVINCEIRAGIVGKFEEEESIRTFIFGLAFCKESAEEGKYPIQAKELKISAQTIIDEIQSIFQCEWKEGKYPVSKTDPSYISPNIGKVSASIVYEKSSFFTSKDCVTSQAQRMLIGDHSLLFSKVHIPFVSKTMLTGVYILIEKNEGPPSLLFKFIDSKGKYIQRRYIFSIPIFGKEWYYLPVSCDDIVQCVICVDSGSWETQNGSYCCISSLLFISE